MVLSATSETHDFLVRLYRPQCIEDKPISQVNLWMTVQPGRTTLHYDAYQNILVVLYGKKTVTLFPPSDAAKLYPFPVHTKSANHSQVNIVEPDLKAHPRFREATVHQFEVTTGGELVELFSYQRAR